MTKVVVSMKIFPSDITINLNSLKEKVKSSLPEYASVHKFVEEPIAFGLVALIAYIVFPEEKSGGLDDVEKHLRNIDGISEIEILMMWRA
ncbi:MAG: Elongation factor 1-beta [Candidatus Bathyarchaeota archaeon BA1]|nr:MAG: Elongation factor 1-beta [Candidatus Bathyarchaeota archaeon BA1]